MSSDTTIDPAALAGWVAKGRTALCVIDIQADFAAPDGLCASFEVDMSAVPAAIAKCEALVAGARASGVPVVFVGLETSPETDSASWNERMRRMGGDPDVDAAVCRKGTPGAAFYGPQPAPGEPVVMKPKYSAFYKTDMEEVLAKLGVDTLVVCGLTTECCVDSTVRDAFHRDFHVFIAGDACAAYGDEVHQSSLDVLKLNCAIIVDTDEVLTAWQEAAQMPEKTSVGHV